MNKVEGIYRMKIVDSSDKYKKVIFFFIIMKMSNTLKLCSLKSIITNENTKEN